MPGGISNPVAGYATFALVKFVGYSAAGYALGKLYPGPRVNAAKSGLARTGIGLIVGAAYGSLILGIAHDALGEQVGLVFLAGLVPLRLGEWWLLIWLYYDRRLGQVRRGWASALAGTAWSFALDVPALMGAISTAGVWIC